MAQANWNQKIIEEFRANEGRVGGPFEGAPMVLLTTTGAKTGRSHTTPLMYLPEGDRVVVFGSKGGAPEHPQWFNNLVANPKVKIEVGTETHEATARVAEGEERERLYREQARRYPQFAEYQQKTSRQIPVVILEKAG
ncbi:MAG TPA: nitroreductase family deazaflavin-dependent oxidoreductase [Actinomycetota bacterium]|nr:nitroreductase family deazaflavin-dependent oxidoreductase [Actinomycetota bacterium]